MSKTPELYERKLNDSRPEGFCIFDTTQNDDKESEFYCRLALYDNNANGDKFFDFAKLLSNKKSRYYDKERAEEYYTKAAQLYKIEADNLNVDSCFKLGSMYYHGKGVPLDKEMALCFFVKAGLMGHIRGLLNAGCLLQDGDGVKKNLFAAFKFINGAYQKEKNTTNTCFAFYDYGLSLLTGRGCEQNKSLAFNVFLEGSERCCRKCDYALGVCYIEGYGTEKNNEMGINYLNKAIEKKHISASNLMAYLRHTGNIVKKDYEECLKLLELGVECKNIHALHNKACMLFNGEGCQEDKKTAYKYFLKGNKYKNVESTFIVGYLLVFANNEDICPFDLHSGIVYLKKAADLNHPAACYYLSKCMLKETPENEEKALEYMEKARILGFKEEVNIEIMIKDSCSMIFENFNIKKIPSFMDFLKS